MDCSRKVLVNFSTRSPLSGSEVPVNKIIKPSQVHQDFQSFRRTATFIVSPSPQIRTNPASPKNFASTVTSANPFRPRKLTDPEIPAQLLCCGSFAEVPVQTHSMQYGRSDAVQIARQKQNSSAGPKAPVQSEPRNRVLDFEPYTVNDYRKLKPSLSQTLGGLGPFTVGSERWQQATDKLTRMKDFSATIRRTKTVT